LDGADIEDDDADADTSRSDKDRIPSAGEAPRAKEGAAEAERSADRRLAWADDAERRRGRRRCGAKPPAAAAARSAVPVAVRTITSALMDEETGIVPSKRLGRWTMAESS
jgi:hypothetical protein